jgi:hypothetical protein
MDNLEARKAVEKVMERFNFEPVREYMERVGWRYFDDTSTPSIETLKETARRCLFSVIGSKDPRHGAASPGGFTARLDRWEKSGPFYLDLQFIPFHTEVHF